jgi:uncharacterized protein (DUF1778 family)
MKDKNTSALFIKPTKEEHKLIKEQAKKLGLSIKEFILLAVYNLTENKDGK